MEGVRGSATSKPRYGKYWGFLFVNFLHICELIRYLGIMKRFLIMVLLATVFVLAPGSDSNAAVIDKATYQVNAHDIQLNVVSPTKTNLSGNAMQASFIGQEIFVLFIPEFGQMNPIFVNVDEKTFAGYSVAIRPPPDGLSKYIREDIIFPFMLSTWLV